MNRGSVHKKQIRCTVLTSPEKGETAVHCCDPVLSVLVMLVSARNVLHEVSALQSIVFLWLVRSLVHPTYFSNVYRIRSHVVFGFSYVNKQPYGMM